MDKLNLLTLALLPGARRGGRSVTDSPFQIRPRRGRAQRDPALPVLRRLQTSPSRPGGRSKLEYSGERLTYEVELVTTDDRLIGRWTPDAAATSEES